MYLFIKSGAFDSVCYWIYLSY